MKTPETEATKDGQPSGLAVAPCSASMCARCGKLGKMKSFPWCDYCWHIETAPFEDRPKIKPECCTQSEWDEIQSSAAHEASLPNMLLDRSDGQKKGE